MWNRIWLCCPAQANLKPQFSCLSLQSVRKLTSTIHFACIFFALWIVIIHIIVWPIYVGSRIPLRASKSPKTDWLDESKKSIISRALKREDREVEEEEVGERRLHGLRTDSKWETVWEACTRRWKDGQESWEGALHWATCPDQALMGCNVS